MGRENCNMYHLIDGVMYCDFFDYGFMPCHKVEVCLDGLDEEDIEDFEDDENLEDDWEE